MFPCRRFRRRAFTLAARFQMDLGPRSVLVLSGLARDASSFEGRNGAGGVAFGFAPTRRISTWTEVDAQVHKGAVGAPAATGSRSAPTRSPPSAAALPRWSRPP